MASNYDAILVVSFGGPDRREDVLPFLENVLRGRNVPRERMLEVAEHYYHFGGRSPINDQNRALIAALEKELQAHGSKLPVYWGNRNWHPVLADTVRQMAADGVRRALAFVTSAYGAYSSCRQYRENIAAARAEVGRNAPEIHKLRTFFNHPGFIEPMVENTCAAFAQLPADRREHAALVFTAHSIPKAMAETSPYEAQLREASRLVALAVSAEGRQPPALPGFRDAGAREPQAVNRTPAEPGADFLFSSPVAARPWHLVYQSRSGPPQQPWLEPDIGDFLRDLAQQGTRDVIIVPIGFTSDHMEVLYDLDTEAKQLCEHLGVKMVRAATVGTHPGFITMIRELIEERLTDTPIRLALGTLGPSFDECLLACCAYVPMPKKPSDTRNQTPDT